MKEVPRLYHLGNKFLHRDAYNHKQVPRRRAIGTRCATGCSGKIVVFLQFNSLQPLPRLHRCKRPSKLSTQCECTVTPIGCFFVQPIAAECWRGRGGKLLRILGKKTQY